MPDAYNVEASSSVVFGYITILFIIYYGIYGIQIFKYVVDFPSGERLGCYNMIRFIITPI